jgi:hypothetical protein
MTHKYGFTRIGRFKIITGQTIEVSGGLNKEI